MGMDFGLVGLHVKGVLTGKLFALSREQLTLGGQSLPVPPSPKMSKHH